MARQHWCIVASLVTAVLLMMSVGCSRSVAPGGATSPEAGGVAEADALTREIESLYLTWYRLDTVYKDIKSLEKGYLFDRDDRQLGYVQKASLYVQDAALRVHHQWQRLSVIDYIRPSMVRDYLTLCVKGLTLNLDEIDYDQMFLRIYTPAIKNEAVAGDLEKAQALIDENVAVLKRILVIIEPLARERPVPI